MHRLAHAASWLALLLSACGGGLAPVLNVEAAPVVVPAGIASNRAYVRDAIVRALSSRAWQVDQETADGFTATTSAGGHTGTVHIAYDDRTYSIHYLNSSSGLKYNGSAIHRRYNHWVDRLRTAIRAQLVTPTVAVGYPPPPPAAVYPSQPVPVYPSQPAPATAAPPPPPAAPTVPTVPAVNDAPPPPPPLPPPPPPAAPAPVK